MSSAHGSVSLQGTSGSSETIFVVYLKDQSLMNIMAMPNMKIVTKMKMMKMTRLMMTMTMGAMAGVGLKRRDATIL